MPTEASTGLLAPLRLTRRLSSSNNGMPSAMCCWRILRRGELNIICRKLSTCTVVYVMMASVLGHSTRCELSSNFAIPAGVLSGFAICHSLLHQDKWRSAEEMATKDLLRRHSRNASLHDIRHVTLEDIFMRHRSGTQSEVLRNRVRRRASVLWPVIRVGRHVICNARSCQGQFTVRRPPIDLAC